jgi:hypothetical protein
LVLDLVPVLPHRDAKPVRRGSPTLGRFDSCAAPYPRNCLHLRVSSTGLRCRGAGGSARAIRGSTQRVGTFRAHPRHATVLIGSRWERAAPRPRGSRSPRAAPRHSRWRLGAGPSRGVAIHEQGDWLAVLHGELAQLGPGQRLVIAHSCGIALWLLAASELTPEERVDRVALVAPPGPSPFIAPYRAFLSVGIDWNAVARASA